MSVLQLCPGSSYFWNDKYTPATASLSSPPLTPLAEVSVVAKKTKAPAKTTNPTSKPSAPAHAH